MSLNGIDFAEVVTLVNDPEPRVSQGGKSWCTFRAAFTPKERDRQSGDMKDGETVWIGVRAHNQISDSIVATFHKGDRALVKGKVTVQRYTDNSGTEREGLSLVVDEIGACPRFALVTIQRQRAQNGPQGGGNTQPGTGGGWADSGASNGFPDDEPF